MALSRLQDDLLQEFREEKKLISAQLELFDPLAASLRQPAARRLVNKGLLIFIEILAYLLSAGSVAVVIFMNKLFPLYVLDALRRKGLEHYDRYETDSFFWLVAGLIVFTGLLLFIIARIVRRVRLKNNVLHLAGKHIKTLVGQHLHRKAAIDSIEQRHFTELPDIQPVATGVNTVPNPGYDGEKP
jgi:hypothetical protein